MARQQYALIQNTEQTLKISKQLRINLQQVETILGEKMSILEKLSPSAEKITMHMKINI